MQLQEEWEQLQRKGVQFHVWNAGTSEENRLLEEQLKITAFTIQGDPDLTLHRTFGLTEIENNYEYALRGYAIIHQGTLIEAKAVPLLSDMAVQIADKAAKQQN